MFLAPLEVAILLGVLVCFLTVISLCVYWHAVSIAPLSEKKERLKEEIESLQNTQSDLKEELANMNTQRAEAQRIIADGEAMKKYLDEHRDEEAHLRAHIAAAQEALKAAEDNYHVREEELQKTELALQTVAGENQKLSLENEKLRRENEVHTTTVEDLKREISHLHEERSVAAHQTDEAKEELLKLQSDISERRTEIARLDNEIAAKEREFQKLNERNTRCEQDLQKARQLKDQYEADYRQVISEISEKQAELRTIRGALATTAPASEGIRWGDLNRPVFKVKSSRGASPQEETWLEEFKKKLSENGISFHARMINAFHTGLKVADYSPLVVLAGISGTGKSLLPRLYAKALGMNFLQIAVQPRWDNPQDMFGFYNYMEGRYKATELSRMLWQFDIHNNPAAGKYAERLPMNLVLLDEMNLAKVEYYFSDMLSKLEVRRGVNVNDDASRRNAEIEIECGALRDEDSAKRLFVGRNTLFVGTMNEDESTQSLSDKVIDRSNVLRFGRPDSLESRSDVETFERMFADVPQMTFSEWEHNWIQQTLKESVQLERTLSEINGELAKIGRPFAYRMYGAIRAYVANYPVGGEQGFRDALADQIEMKVLPKLNGVEKESSQRVKEALDRIGDIIADVKDEQLLNAFIAAKDDRDAVFFQWRGVTRKN